MARQRQRRSIGVNPTGSQSILDGGDPRRFDGVGATLRAERMRRGWEIADVANHLKIRRVHLEAIEDERFDLIPSGTYAVNFVRSYSVALGLDAAEMVRRYRQALAGGDQRLELNFPQPLPESRLPGGIIILASIAIAALGYGAWTAFNQDQRETLARVDPVPQQLQAAAPQSAPTLAPAPVAAPALAAPPPPPVPAAPPPAPPAADPPSAAAPPAAAAPLPPPPPPRETQAALPPALSASPPPAPALPAIPPPADAGAAAAQQQIVAETASGTRIFGEPAPATRVVITAQADSWVQIRDAAGSIVFMRILKAGDAYHVPNRPGLLLTTGSAGSIDIKVDGKQAPSLGRTGFVRRDVPLEPDRLLAGGEGVRPPQAPPPRNGG